MVVGRRHFHATDAALRRVLRGDHGGGVGGGGGGSGGGPSLLTVVYFVRGGYRPNGRLHQALTFGKWRHGWAPVASAGDAAGALEIGARVADKYAALGLPPVGAVGLGGGALNRRRGRGNAVYRVSLATPQGDSDPCVVAPRRHANRGMAAAPVAWGGAANATAPPFGAAADEKLFRFLQKASAFAEFTLDWTAAADTTLST